MSVDSAFEVKVVMSLCGGEGISRGVSWSGGPGRVGENEIVAGRGARPYESWGSMDDTLSELF